MKKFKIVKNKKGIFTLKQKKGLWYSTVGEEFINYDECERFLKLLHKDSSIYEIKYNVREW